MFLKFNVCSCFLILIPPLMIAHRLNSSIGIDICKRLKSQRESADIPIIMISAHPAAEKMIENCDADAFIPKPFNMNTLLDTVARHAEGH